MFCHSVRITTDFSSTNLWLLWSDANPLQGARLGHATRCMYKHTQKDFPFSLDKIVSVQLLRLRMYTRASSFDICLNLISHTLTVNYVESFRYLGEVSEYWGDRFCTGLNGPYSGMPLARRSWQYRDSKCDIAQSWVRLCANIAHL